MANAHRTNVLITSCLKTPVDPHTKAPLASYERGRVLPYTTVHLDNRDYESEVKALTIFVPGNSSTVGAQIQDVHCNHLFLCKHYSRFPFYGQMALVLIKSVVTECKFQSTEMGNTTF